MPISVLFEKYLITTGKEDTMLIKFNLLNWLNII